MPPSRFRGRGFTLLEILVVVFIIGILLTAVTVMFGSSEMTRVREEADRLATLITLAREQAILDGQEIAVAFDDTGYAFQVYDGQGWLALEGDDILRRRTFPDIVDIEVNLVGEPVKLVSTASEEEEDADKDDKKDKEKEPIRVFLLSSGEVTPFEIFVGHEEVEGGFMLTGDAVGKIDIRVIEGTS